MPVFKDSQQVSDMITDLWKKVFEDEKILGLIEKNKLTVYTELREPEAHIWVGSGQVFTGEEAKKDALIRLSMTADTANEIYSQNKKLTGALASGEVKARGPAMKLMKIVPLLQKVYTEWPALKKQYEIPE